MDLGRIISKTVGLAVFLTIIFPLVQIGIGYLGIAWFAPLPPQALGKTFWGVPWGLVGRVVYPNAPYTIEWNYLIYDLIFWVALSFVYYSIKYRKRS